MNYFKILFLICFLANAAIAEQKRFIIYGASNSASQKAMKNRPKMKMIKMMRNNRGMVVMATESEAQALASSLNANYEEDIVFHAIDTKVRILPPTQQIIKKKNR